jgi:glucosamine-6-phosphate deaminase
MEVIVCADPPALARHAADALVARVRARPTLTIALPAGRTPRPMYAELRELHRRGRVDFSRMRVFAVDELCPPAPADGYFWRQLTSEFLAWAGIPSVQWARFDVAAPNLAAMCAEYEGTLARAGGLDVVMLGLGWNGHLASNEPGSPFDAPTRPTRLLPETVRYILTDPVRPGPVTEAAVTLGLRTIMAAREVIVLVSGAAKRVPLAAMRTGAVTPAVPASILRTHPRCLVLADREALG